MNPLTPDTFMVDNTMVDLISTCPWLAYASIIRRRRPAGDAPALRFGAFIHEALAYRYQHFHDKVIEKPIETVMLEILSERFSSTPCELEGWRNFDNACKVIRGYNAFHENERSEFSVVHDPKTGLPRVEQPFAVDTHKVVRGRRIIYTGKIDLPVNYPDQSLYIMDHKTTTRLGDEFWQDQQMTGQHRGYIWAYRECTGEEATGYIVNAIGISQYLQNAFFDENLGRVMPGLTNSGKQSKSTPCEFQRQRYFTRVPPGQIDEWFENMLAIVDEFLYNVDRNNFPRHWKQCVGKYGLCQFFNVCSLPQESRENALTSGAYQENEWTPLYQ